MTTHRKLKDAVALVREKRPEISMTLVRDAIAAGKIPCRKTSEAAHAWIWVRASDIVKHFERIEKKINNHK